MADYVPELKVLGDILLERKNYREAMFKTNMEENLSSIGKKRLQENVLGVLRHYFCLSFECQNQFLYPVNSEEHILLLIALHEIRYHKDISFADVSHRYHDAFMKMRLTGDLSENIDKLGKMSKESFMVPEEVKKSPLLYNSLVLEFPEFLLRNLSQDYSSERALCIASKAHRRPNFFYASSLRNEADITDESLEYLNLDDGFGVYESKKMIPMKELKKMGLYPIGYVEALGYSKVRIPSLMPNVLMTGLDDGFSFLPVAFGCEKYYQGRMVSVYEDDISYRSGMDAVSYFKLKKTKVIHSSLKLLKTFEPYDSFDVVIMHGKDLKTGKSRIDPSILPSLKENMISRSFNEQVEGLLGNAEFVKKGGYLLFVNHGLLKKETDDVIYSFLDKRKDFSMIVREVVFPDKMDSEGGYYCLLKRKVEKDD